MKGRPATPQRWLLLDILRHAEGHLDARGLYRRAIEKKDPRISLATVYRSLHLFKELGLVDEVHLDEARCYYEIRRSANHYHLVCKSCGRVTEFESSTVSNLVDEVQRNSGFDVTRVELYLEGYCRKCKGRKEAS
jgi:Fe2+ or Zn2+ uptake regulation protein